MAEELSIAKHVKDLKEMLAKPSVQAHLAKVIPNALTPERMLAVAVTAVQKVPALAECSPLSIVSSIVQASQLGLEIDNMLGHAYLVPFKNSKTGKREAQLIIGYRGFIELARRSGEIRSVYAEIVREGDEFEIVYGTHRSITHKAKLRKRGEPEPPWLGVYAVAEWKDGGFDFEFLDADDVAKIRGSSKAADSGPWVTWTEEMWRKSSVRRLCKRLPLSVTDKNHALARAAAIDEAREHGLVESPLKRAELPLGIEDLTFAPEGAAASPEGANDSEPSAGAAATASGGSALGQQEQGGHGSEEEMLRYRVKELGKSLGYNEAKVNMLLGQHAGRLPLIEELQREAKQGPREVKKSDRPNPRFTF